MQITHDRKLLIAIGRSRRAASWKNTKYLWSDFLDRLATTTRTRETTDEYAALPKSEKDDIKDIGGFVGGYLKNGKRNNASVNNRCMLCLDIDYADEGIFDDAVADHQAGRGNDETHRGQVGRSAGEKRDHRSVLPGTRDHRCAGRHHLGCLHRHRV